MLRLLVLLLLLANGGYFAWSKGLLAPYGVAPSTQSEPQRLAQQIRPEAMRITVPVQTVPAAPAAAPALTASEAALSPPAASASSAVSSSTQTVSAGPAECLQAGLFNEEQTVVLRTRLQEVLPANSWALESSIEPARWMVYMGKYSGPDALEKKRGELRQLRVSFAPLNNPSLEPGLSLGTFNNKPDADTELARIATRGVRTAKVVQTATEARGQKLRLPAVTAALKPQLEAIKPQLAGKPLKACG
ncbi:MAG: SPOR domain-containing protein [Pseudomonadota bacterium]